VSDVLWCSVRCNGRHRALGFMGEGRGSDAGRRGAWWEMFRFGGEVHDARCMSWSMGCNGGGGEGSWWHSEGEW